MNIDNLDSIGVLKARSKAVRLDGRSFFLEEYRPGSGYSNLWEQRADGSRKRWTKAAPTCFNRGIVEGLIEMMEVKVVTV